ncbi:hypothetical protein IJO12_01165 [bacterium]|nr:hypothetical protein [bacterium]
MKKLILFLVTVLIFCFNSAQAKEKAFILFNKHPITNETITSTSNTNEFNSGERIYYLIGFPEKLYKKSLLIQIFKVGGDKDERFGHEIVWGKRVKLKTQQHNFYTDYIVINQNGVFVMKVYSRDYPTKILTSANFYVKN